VADQGLDAAETLGERDEAHAVQHLPRALERADVEREHAAEAAHLAARQRVVRVVRQPRVDHPPHAGMRREELGQGLPVRAVLPHAQGEGLGAAQDEPRVERAEDRAGRVLHEPQPLDVLVARRHDHAAHAVRVPVQVLRRAVDDEVGAEREGALQRRAREGVVHDEAHAARARDLGGAGDVGHAEHRVGRCLDEDHLRLGAQRLDEAVGHGRVHPAERQAVARQDALEQPEGAAVGVVGHDDVIAGLQEGGDGVDRGHARRERERRPPALDRGEVGLERAARRVLRPRVLVALVPAQLVLHVGRGLEDGRDDRAGARVGRLSGVDAHGVEARGVAEFHGW
jgi:hypothetical protein